MAKSRINAEELALFNSQLAAIARSEVPALPGLKALSSDVRRGRLRRVLDTLVSEIESGKALQDALEDVSDRLPPTYAAMIRAGVESRNLPAVLESMTQHYQASEDLKQKIQGALIYPGIIYALCITLLFFAVFVVSPLVTRFAEDLYLIVKPSHTAASLILVFELGCGLAVVLAAIGLRIASISPGGARFAERACNAVPIYGAVGRNGSLARFCSSLAVLLGARVPLGRALELVRLTVGSPGIADALTVVSRQTSDGMELGESLKHSGVFPHTLVWMVSQGEESNTLVETLGDLSDFYTAETRRQAALAWNATTPLAVGILFFSGFPTMMAFWGMLHNLLSQLGEY